MRMHADGCINRGMTIREADARFKIRRTVTRADGEHALDACFKGSLDHGVTINVELFVIEMAMRVDQHHVSWGYLRRAPTGMSSRNPASTGAPSPSDAATIMP